MYSELRVLYHVIVPYCSVQGVQLWYNVLVVPRFSILDSCLFCVHQVICYCRDVPYSGKRNYVLVVLEWEHTGINITVSQQTNLRSAKIGNPFFW